MTGRVLAAALAAAALAAPAAPAEPHYVTRPDLVPPVIKVTHPARGAASGLLFVAPKHNAHQPGPMILTTGATWSTSARCTAASRWTSALRPTGAAQC